MATPSSSAFSPNLDPAAPGSGASPSALCRLVYTSVATVLQTPHQLHALVGMAGARNRQAGITGLLVSSGEAFLQYLEGPSGALAMTLAELRADPRHHSLRVLAHGPIARRRFGAWDMAGARVSAPRWRGLVAAWERGAPDGGVDAEADGDETSGIDLLQCLWSRPRTAERPDAMA